MDKKYQKTRMLSIDEIDTNIIHELQVDARKSYLVVGNKIGTSEGTVRNRLQKLLHFGVIKLKAVLNPTTIGFNFVCVIGLEIAIDKINEAGAILAEDPHIIYLAGCTGAFDLIGILIFQNSSEFDHLLKEHIAKLPGIKKSQTFVNMNLIKAPWTDDIDIKKLIES